MQNEQEPEYSVALRNKRNYQGPGTYIGRFSPLGNPFKIGTDGTRAQVIEKYKEWLLERLDPLNMEGAPQRKALEALCTEMRETGTITLVCYCAPKPCHGEVVAAAVLGTVSGAGEVAGE